MSYDISDEEAAKGRAVVGGDFSIGPPPLRRMTEDEARAAVARSVAEQLGKSIKLTQEELSKVPFDPESAEQHNILLAALATKELHDSLLVSAAQFERPRILRPERSVRIVR